MSESVQRCKFCLQALDPDNPLASVVLPSKGDKVKTEDEATRDPLVAVQGVDEEDKQQLMLYDFSLYDSLGHLVPINDQLLKRRDGKLHFNGIVKAPYSSAESDDGVLVVGAGPITEWWITGIGKDEKPHIGISTYLADYYLRTPSETYSTIHTDLEDKVRLTGVVYSILDDVKEKGFLNAFTYENMLERLAILDHEINEELLLQYGVFIVQQVSFFKKNSPHFPGKLNYQLFFEIQIHSYDSAADQDEVRVTFLNCVAVFYIVNKELKRVAGVVLEEDTRSLKRNLKYADDHHEVDLGQQDGYKPNSVTKATTTKLVRHVFESYFTTFLSRTGSKNKMANGVFCGVCKGCQQKDCGHCESCQKMVKFGGDDDSVVCQMRYCAKNGKAVKKVPSIVENQRRLTKQRETKVKWLLPIHSKSTEDRRYYAEAKINGKVVSVGDCVLVRPDDIRTPLFVFKIVSLFQLVKNESSLEGKLAHVQKFCRGSDTILGETSDPKELFALNSCETIQLFEVEDKATVAYWRGPANFKDLGNTDLSIVTPSAELGANQFWYRMSYESSCARFETVDPRWIHNEGGCFCCELQNIQKQMLTPVLVDGNVLRFRGQEFRVGDGLYLEPGTFEHVGKYNGAKANSNVMIDKNVDTTIHTEYYRKLIKTSENIKGDASVFPNPYEIGVISKLRPSKSDPSVPRCAVRVFYRPENIKNLDGNPKLINYLFSSNEEEYLTDLNKIQGKCEVLHASCVPGDIFTWTKAKLDRFFYDSSYDREEKNVALVPSTTTKKEKMDQVSVRPLRMMDVFAGVGGLSVGLEQAKVAEAKWAIEFVKEAASAFKVNHPNCEVMLEDCNVILEKVLSGKTLHRKKIKMPMRGEVEMLCGGPPCQGFSMMNRFNEREYSTFKNSQVSSFLSYCDYYRPRFFILENVKNFGSFKDSIVLKLCMRVLVYMGYQCTFGVLQAGQYGVPQTRRRIFLIAAAPGEVLPHYPEPTHVFLSTDSVKVDKKSFKINMNWTGHAPLRCVTTRDALSDLPPIVNGQQEPWLDYKSAPESHYQRLMRYDDTKGSFSKVVNDHVCKSMDPMYEARFKHIPRRPGADWRDLPNIRVPLTGDKKGRYAERLWYYYKDARNVKERIGKDAVCECATVDHKGRKHRCNPMDEQKNTLIPWFLPHTAHRNNQWAGLYGRIDWDGYFSTTVTDPSPGGKQGRVLHPDQDRVISVRECARSQGFKDNFKFCGSVTAKHRQIGNAVPPPLAEAIGREIFKSLQCKEASMKPISNGVNH